MCEPSAPGYRYPKRNAKSNFFKQGANPMNKISVRLTATALIICLCIFFAAAQTKPNLTGTWKMNPSKSKFVNGGPNEIIIKFDQKDSSFAETLTVTENNGEHQAALKYTADGKAATNQIEEKTVTVTAKWEGETLVIEMMENENLFIRKITLAADGKSMTMAVHRSKGDRVLDETVVLEKL
jgi:hypothetical protein